LDFSFAFAYDFQIFSGGSFVPHIVERIAVLLAQRIRSPCRGLRLLASCRHLQSTPRPAARAGSRRRI